MGSLKVTVAVTVAATIFFTVTQAAADPLAPATNNSAPAPAPATNNTSLAPLPGPNNGTGTGRITVPVSVNASVGGNGAGVLNCTFSLNCTSEIDPQDVTSPMKVNVHPKTNIPNLPIGSMIKGANNGPINGPIFRASAALAAALLLLALQ